MKEITRRISLDLARRSNSRVAFACESDMKSREFLISLFDDGVPYIVDKSLTASINVCRPDGQRRAYLAEITDEGCIRYVPGNWALMVAGDARFSVSLYDGEEKKLSSTAFTVSIEEGIYFGDDIEEGDDTYTAFMEMMNSMAYIKDEELKRDAAERERVNNESIRVDFELDRAGAESRREETELLRCGMEVMREDAEKKREEAEEKRKIAEGSAYSGSAYYGGRELKEVLREEGEILRKSAEDAREDAEERRRAAEGSVYSGSPYYGGRALEEYLRCENENSRVAAEKKRVENENARLEVTDTLKEALANLITLQEQYIAKGATV